jgi:hypothetical protein
MLDKYRDELMVNYVIELPENGHFLNPLYCGGVVAQEHLINLTNPPLYNGNQFKELADPTHPFFFLTNITVVDLTNVSLNRDIISK